MEKSKKPDSSRLNLFYILYVLDKYTDADNPLSASDIAKKVNSDFSFTSVSESVISVATVKRTLDELIYKIFNNNIEYLEKKQDYGFYIFCVMKENDNYVIYKDVEEKSSQKKYYYLEKDITVAEILTLKDAIETYSYFSEEDITEIVRKLIQIRQCSFPKKYIDIAKKDRDEDSMILMNIDLLNEIILRGNCAKITYCTYNWKKELTPRKGYPKIITPLKMMWSNGYYYLLAYNRKYKSIINFRLDRITEIEEIEEKRKYELNDFNLVQYRHEHPVMSSGEVQNNILLCRDMGDSYLMNGIIDTFGKNIHISEPDDQMYLKYLKHPKEYYDEQGITWYKLSFKAVSLGVELWATQYCADCVVVSPQETVDRVKERLKNGLSLYED